MNLVFFLLSFLFASYAPTTIQTTDDGDTTTTVNNPDPGKGKGGKFRDGEYIISNDINP
ncbi:MAG: hypothetical protein ACKVT2_13850 [Saprospiraceae bacterium]